MRAMGAIQIRTVLSSEADASISGLVGFQLTLFTVPECPSSCASRSPLSLCQTRALRRPVHSTLPDRTGTQQAAPCEVGTSGSALLACWMSRGHASDPEATKAALVPPKQERMMKRGCLLGSIRYSIAGSLNPLMASSAYTFSPSPKPLTLHLGPTTLPQSYWPRPQACHKPQ